MIDFDKLKNIYNENCLKCGGNFNKALNICDNCKSENNNRISSFTLKKHKAIQYRNADMNNKNVVVATLKDSQGNYKKIIVPPNSQIAMRVISNIDSNITDFLEDGLTNQKLIDYSLFKLMNIGNEKYYILKSLL